MTDTLQAPVIPPTPPASPRRNPALTGLTIPGTACCSVVGHRQAGMTATVVVDPA